MIEFELKIPDVNIEDAKNRLQKIGAVLQKSSYVQKNIMLHLPSGREIAGGWLRVRDEGEKITMSLKIIDGKKITDQREFCFFAESMEEASEFLETMGAREKARSEKRRETWTLGKCEVVIDEWPFLEPIIEVEGPDEKTVVEAVKSLGYDIEKCRVCAISKLYKEKYGVSEDIVNNHTPRILFDMKNPFLG
ncbi:MAG: CYTH domain-containing protein [Candidatus Pacebacteria bacterium]|nr:CYTH domain-containing protein [Candidatus Paceibacterota bacterium]